MAESANVLPFERGSIWQDGNTAATGQTNGMPGSRWTSQDSDRPSTARHNRNEDETLLVLRNQHASGAIGLVTGHIAVTNVVGASRGFRMRTAASGSDGAVGSNATGHGGFGYALDDSYNTNSSRIPVGCDAYFIQEGLSRVLLHTSPGTGTANLTRLTWTTSGNARALWVTGSHRAFGVTKETFTNTATHRAVLVGIGPRYLAGDLAV